jgi:CRISPR-associated endonuclease/helicase Cas3
MKTFDEFFRSATASEKHPEGCSPHGYQARIARGGLPAILQAPTGTGKTGIILAWLWRLFSNDNASGTPRRLVYALPQRSLVEQVSHEAEMWLARLNLTGQVALHVVMGGRGESQRQWRQDMDRPAIVIGTVDSLVSKALNRGYGIGRAIYPVDFALVMNGAHWVIDEIQLCRESTTTLRQLAAFARTYGTAEPFSLTCMSATVPPGLLETVDNPVVDGVKMAILQEERTGELAVRLEAKRTIRKLDAVPGGYKEIAAAALDRHRAGELTLVVLNTVDAAKEVFKHVRKGASKATLLHSRFRGIEREQLLKTIITDPKDRIVVSTQVVEAGIDLNASVLITEAAPWPSVVQRAGRCNRTGTILDAELCWVQPKNASPYEQDDIDATAAALSDLAGTEVTGEDLLLGREVKVTEEQVSVLRRPDFLALFDTSPDLAGNDIDVAPYVRDAEDLDAQVAWATWVAAAADGRPPDDAKAPSAEYRCRVPLGKVTELAKIVPVWRLDQVLRRWTKVVSQARARPGEVLVISADAGGYDPDTGFEPTAKGPVVLSARLRAKSDPPDGIEEAYGDDSSNVQQKRWLPLDQHSQDVRDEAVRLLATIQPELSADAQQSAVVAAYLHDAGKAHPVWQDAICRLQTTKSAEEIAVGRPWAKSDSDEQLHCEGGAFRHELASLLLVDGPLRTLLAQAPDQDLARYLVLAHHGKLRIQVRDPGDLAVISPDEAAEKKILGLAHGKTYDIPAFLNQPASQLTVDLNQFELGNNPSWTRTVSDLLDRYGPFRLAYLEAVVRVADWRASANPTEAE